jgi:DNA-binding transcriptional regulator YhcF (GntR family)
MKNQQEKLMDFQVDKESNIPVYRQIMSQIVTRVQAGALKPGDKLPPERELAIELGVARGTIKKAYEVLEGNRILEAIQGRGSFVANRQNAPVGDRRSIAVKRIDEMLDEFEGMGFDDRETTSLIHMRMMERDKDTKSVIIAGIDCNPEALSIFEKQFSDYSHVVFKQVLLETLQKERDVHSQLDIYDILLTTATHYQELIELVPYLKNKILQVAVMPSQQTIVDLARIPNAASIGIVCRSQRFLEIIKESLTKFGVGSGSGFGSEPESGFGRIENLFDGNLAKLSSFLLGKSRVIVPPNSPLLDKRNQFPELETFITGGGQLILFDYQMQRGSMIYIEEEIYRIISKKALQERT